MQVGVPETEYVSFVELQTYVAFPEFPLDIVLEIVFDPPLGVTPVNAPQFDGEVPHALD
mgnify:CR=1 FL=1